MFVKVTVHTTWQKLVLFFYRVGSKDPIQTVKLGNKHLYPQSYLSDPVILQLDIQSLQLHSLKGIASLY